MRLGGPLRVVLAEDSVLVREGIIDVLARFEHQVLEAVGDADSVAGAVEKHKPDVLITDVRMPPGHSDDGLRAAVQIRQTHPEIGVLVLSQFVATDYVTDLLASATAPGAGLGYLLKDRIGDVLEFVDALERIAAGATVIDPEVITQLLAQSRQSRPLSGLTPREREVLSQMAAGNTNKMIAESMTISEAAVAKHIGNIFTKFHLDSSDGHRRVLAVLRYLREESAL